MKASKVAVALVLAIATSAALAASGDTQTADSGHKWYQAGERALQSQQQLNELERQGFQQYAD